jgi:hypothetical protein
MFLDNFLKILSRVFGCQELRVFSWQNISDRIHVAGPAHLHDMDPF